MRAARWDTTVERGGAWRRVLRRTAATGDMPLTTPLTIDIFAITEPSGAPGAPVLTVSGVLAANTLSATFDLTAAQTNALAAGRYEHKLTVGDPNLSGPVILARGYLTVYDSVQG